MKVYLFSAFGYNSGFSVIDIANDLKEDVNGKKIIFVGGFNNDAKNNDEKELVLKWFRNIGIEFSEIKFIEDANDDEFNGSVVYLLKGVANYQMYKLLELNMIEKIKKADVVIGQDAGTINLSENSLVCQTRFNDHPSLIRKGIGLVNMPIEVHFNPDNVYHNNGEVIMTLDKDKCYAISDGSAIVLKDDTCKLFGEIYEVSYLGIKKVDNVDIKLL